MVIISKHLLPDDIYSECLLNIFEIYEIWSIDINRILNTNNIHNCINSNSHVMT